MKAAAAPLALLIALGLLLAQQHGLIVQPTRSEPVPWPTTAQRTGVIALGVTTAPLARDAWRAWTPRDLTSVNAFEQAAHQHADIVMWYADWRHSSPSLTQLDAVARRGSIPEITWEPWDAHKRLYQPQPAYRLKYIIEGRYDVYIRSWASVLAAYAKPVRLRFAQEMNGSWYPWSERVNGNHPGEFVRAWRHVHDIFTAAGATNVQWVWAPVSGAPRQDFPGIRYVDRLGVTCMNGGTAAFVGGWRSFARICGASIRELHRLAPALPIDITEMASAEQGGNKAKWITDAFAYLARQPAVKSFIWFNLDKETDWRIWSSATAERAFADGMRSLLGES